MSRIPSNTFESYDAVTLGAFNDRMLQDCGMIRLGDAVVGAAGDPRIVRRGGRLQMIGPFQLQFDDHGTRVNLLQLDPVDTQRLEDIGLSEAAWNAAMRSGSDATSFATLALWCAKLAVAGVRTVRTGVNYLRSTSWWTRPAD